MKLDKPLNLSFDDSAELSIAVPTEHQEDAGLMEQPIDELKKEVQIKSRQIDAKNKEISELKIKNRQLQQENQEAQARQQLMDEELRKAQAQIQLIQELLLGEEDTSDQEERGTSE